MLEINGVSVRRDDRLVLDHVSVTVPYGTTTALVGPSGIGKSTLLHAVCGLIRLDTGRIVIDGIDITDVPPHRRGIGLVTQSGDLFPMMTVRENIEFGLRLRHEPSATRRERVSELLTVVRLEGLEDRMVTTLSGGEQRRIALARALAPRPRVLLLDEPLTGLDQETHDALVTDLGRILRNSRTTTLLVTHDLDEARALGDTIVEL